MFGTEDRGCAVELASWNMDSIIAALFEKVAEAK